MKKEPRKRLTVEELSRLLECPYKGDGSTVIWDAASLEEAEKGSLVFLSHRKYRDLLENTKASAAIAPLEEKFDRIPVIQSENPHLSFVKAVEFLFMRYHPPQGIHPTANISPSAKIGKNVGIGMGVFIEESRPYLVTIEDNVNIGPKAVILAHDSSYHSVCPEIPIITKKVIIKKNAYIGAGAIILPGVTIGIGSIVAAGAVVSKDIPNFSVAAGNPARVVSKLPKPGEKNEA